MTACYDRFNEVIEPAACFNFQFTLHRDSLQHPPPTAIRFYPQRLPTTHVPSQDNHAAGLVHTVLSVCARHSLLGETLHDVLLTLLE